MSISFAFIFYFSLIFSLILLILSKIGDRYISTLMNSAESSEPMDNPESFQCPFGTQQSEQSLIECRTYLCTDTTELIDLCAEEGLFLKPIARLSVTIQLPQLQSGQSISNWELSEKIRELIRPDIFPSSSTLKAVRSTPDYVRFEIDLDNRAQLEKFKIMINEKRIKLVGFQEAFRVRASSAKLPFPDRFDWERFFRDHARQVDETKPGQRPDTVYLSDLPVRWFQGRRRKRREPDSLLESWQPDEAVVRRVFETFGHIRALDMPTLDPSRRQRALYDSGDWKPVKNQEKRLGRRSRHAVPNQSSQEDEEQQFHDPVRDENPALAVTTFDLYVQFREYVSFDKCLNTFRNRKLVYCGSNGSVYFAFIRVSFILIL